MTPMRQGRIRIGARVMQDHGVGRWPATKAGDDIDPDTIFDVVDNGKGRCVCAADGYGYGVDPFPRNGNSRGYGNGAFTVATADVEFID